MKDLIKNIGRAQPLSLKDRVDYEPGKIVSLTLAAQPNAGITLFAFDATEALSPHTAPGDAMAYILEGEARITVDQTSHHLTAGEVIVMPAEIPHAVEALTPFKMLLILIKG